MRQLKTKSLVFSILAISSFSFTTLATENTVPEEEKNCEGFKCQPCDSEDCPSAVPKSYDQLRYKTPLTCPNAVNQKSGCSFVAKFSAIQNHFLENFKPACEELDICYNTPGSEKSTCDNNFHLNMVDICSVTYIYADKALQLDACKIAAEEWTKAVGYSEEAQDIFDADQVWAKNSENCP